MRLSDFPSAAAAVALAVLSSCAADGPARPEGSPPPPAPVTAPEPAVQARPADWRDWPITPGRWQYRPGTPISSAAYEDGQAPSFVVQCDSGQHRVTIMRQGTTAEMTISTSSRTARFPTGHVELEGRAMSAVILNANDAFLDAMAFSRGRLGIAAPGLDPLAIPAWAEPARVVEDCRK